MPMDKYEYVSDVWRDGIFGVYTTLPRIYDPCLPLLPWRRIKETHADERLLPYHR